MGGDGGGKGAGGGGIIFGRVTHLLLCPFNFGPPSHMFSKISYVSLVPFVVRVTVVGEPHGNPGVAP